MTATMYDSTTASDIPTTARMVGGYVDGLYRWSDADWARFPAAVKVRIAVLASTNDGHVLDIEPGAAHPSDAPAWVRMRRAAGLSVPSLYVALWTPGGWSKSIYQATHDAIVSAGIDPNGLGWWVADYNGQANIPSGFVAHQYQNAPGSGGHYDLSVVSDAAPWVPNLVTAGSPGQVGDVNMTGWMMVATNGAAYCYGDVTNHGDAQGLLSGGEVIVSVKLTKSHGGYVMFGNHGSTFSFGDAPVLAHPTNPAGFFAFDAS